MKSNKLNELLQSKLALKIDNKKINEELREINNKLSRINLKSKLTGEIDNGLKKIQTAINVSQNESGAPKLNKTDLFKTLFSVSTNVLESFALQGYLNKISESITRINEADKKFVEYSSILLEYGWTPTPHIAYQTVCEVVEIYNDIILSNQQKKKLITKTIIHYYDQEVLDKILNYWKEKLLLTKRAKILTDAINAHKLGKYNLSVPILISQLEGVLANGFYHKGQLHEPGYKCYLKEVMTISTNPYFDNIAIDFFINVLMINFQHGKNILSLSSRHAILHGADVKYGSKENSLKMILLLDYIQDKFNYFSCENSNVSHIVGCSKVHPIHRDTESQINSSEFTNYFMVSNGRYFKKKIKFYSTIEDLHNNGLRPCKVCMKEQ